MVVNILLIFPTVGIFFPGKSNFLMVVCVWIG